MNPNQFDSAKNCFLDSVNAKDYIEIDRISTIYKSLLDSIKKPLKLVLLYGRPGTGKSMFLTKLFHDLHTKQPLYLYKTPFFDENEFFKTIANDIFLKTTLAQINFNQLIKVVEESSFETTPIVLLDEAQLYSQSLIEKIRLLSDTRKVKFVITLHKTNKEDLIAQEHFQTRIWESIELDKADESELKIYIQKKLMRCGSIEIANMFDSNAIKNIYKYTDGNYRDTNKLLYTLFEIYLIYSKDEGKKRLKSNYIEKKIIEMSALYTGLIDD